MLSTNLYELFQDIRLRGEEAVAADAAGELVQVVQTLKDGLVSECQTTEDFSLKFVITTHDIAWCIHHVGDSTEYRDECSEKHRCTLTGPMAQIMYIISGTQVDDTQYRAKIMVWWQQKTITVDGNLMLMQRIQGYF